MYLSGKVGSRPRISAPSAPPSPARPEPNAKVSANTPLTLMPSPRATRGIIDRARSRLPKRVLREDELQADREQAADHDDEQAVAADADAEKFELPLQHARELDEHLLRAHDVVDRRDRHEDEADGEQHLVEMALAVDVHIERALEQRPDQRGDEEGDGQPGEERHARRG